MLAGALATKNVARLLLLAAACGAGCEVTPEKIATWKDTERGPDKLRDAVKSTSVSPELRGLALTALVEIGKLSEVDEDVKACAEGDRAAIAHAALPVLGKLAQGDNAVDKTTRKQRNAKDALFALRDGASAEDRAKIDDQLIAWTTVNLAERSSEGGHSTEQIL